MYDFLSLSPFYLLEVLQEFISVNENCKLNSAVCNHLSRPQFIRLLQLKSTILPPNQLHPDTHCFELVAESVKKQSQSILLISYKFQQFKNPLELWNLIENVYVSAFGVTYSHRNLFHSSKSLSQLRTKPRIYEAYGSKFMTFWGLTSGTMTPVLKRLPAEPLSNSMEKDTPYIILRDELILIGSMTDDIFTRNILENTAVEYDSHHWNSQKRNRNKLKYCGMYNNTGCNGFGKCLYVGGMVYKGQFVNSIRSGFGDMYYLTNGNTYSGSWDNGMFHGVGTLHQLSDNYIYSGSWDKGMLHGVGTLHQLKDNFMYKGGWNNGQMRGQGVITWGRTNETMSGAWVGNLETTYGNCELTLSNGDVYTGQFHKGHINGIGSAKFTNGDTFEGRFIEYWNWSTDTPLEGSHNSLVKGNWFQNVQAMAGTFTAAGSNSPVWGVWNAPRKNPLTGRWSTGVRNWNRSINVKYKWVTFGGDYKWAPQKRNVNCKCFN